MNSLRALSRAQLDNMRVGATYQVARNVYHYADGRPLACPYKFFAFFVPALHVWK